MKKSSFVLFLAMLMAFTFRVGTVSAQKIACVDINKILESMDDYKKAQSDLDKTASQWRQEIAQQYDDIKSAYNKYQAEQVLISDEAKKQREEDIMNREKLVRDAQKEKFGPEGALFKKRQELVRPIQDRVYAAIDAYAVEKGIDFIFDKSGTAGIIYDNDRYDKTDDIIAKLKK
ncbi:MAG: OmpH family outer membrane protein [Saprospiraceae bacterium]|nr:OmpH family outer membrane protein [Saprospiraceae bacterium]